MLPAAIFIEDYFHGLKAKGLALLWSHFSFVSIPESSLVVFTGKAFIKVTCEKQGTKGEYTGHSQSQRELLEQWHHQGFKDFDLMMNWDVRSWLLLVLKDVLGLLVEETA